MNKFMALLVISVWCWAQGVRADNSNFSYRVKIPATHLSCEQEAARLEQNFRESTKIDNAKGRCLAVLPISEAGRGYQLYSLIIDYSARELQRVYVADFLVDTLDRESMAPLTGYTSYEACLNDIEVQRREFERSTLLQPAAASCQDQSIFGQALFTLRIEAFGVPANKLYYASLGVDPTENRALAEQIQSLLTDQNVRIIKSFERMVFFYAPKRIYVRHLNIGYFKDQKECEIQLAEGKAILTRSGSPKALALCQKNYGSFKIEAFGLGDRFILSDYGGGAPKYDTFSECLGDRDRIISQFAPGTVFGAICAPDSYNDRRYVMNLFH